MELARWRLKQLWMYPFVQTQAGSDVYEWLTAVVLGTQGGMSHKWCSWFKEHMVLCRDLGGAHVPGSRVWLFQPGWSLAPVFLSRIATGRGPLVTEDRSRLAGRYLPVAIEEACEVAEDLVASTQADRSRSALLEELRRAKSPREALRTCAAEYKVGGLDELAAIRDESADICVSMGRLEHLSEDDLRRLFREMHRALASGGVGTHIVDHRDHYWHYDKSIHCFHHLTYSEERWERRCGKGKGYRNRLLEPDYVRLFEEAGFEVLASRHLHSRDAEQVDPTTLWGPYASLSRQDLEAVVSHFIVRRP
jgi:hypothetical protein